MSGEKYTTGHWSPINLRRTLPAVAVVLATVARPAAALPGQAAEERPHYQIIATADLGAGAMEGTELVRYANRTGQVWDRLIFQAEAAHCPGFTVSAWVDGDRVEPEITDMTIDLPLPSAVRPGESVSVRFSFRVVLPHKEGRHGYVDGIMSLGGWYPLAAVFREPRLAGAGPQSWDKHPYPSFGDPYFAEAADYDVALTVAGEPAVARTGTPVRREGSTRHVHAQRVREFALAVSNRYQVSRARTGNVEVVAFVTPEHGYAAPVYLRQAVAMLGWMADRLIPYPLPRLDLVEMPASSPFDVGQEYPGLVMIASSISNGDGSPDAYLPYVVRHEVAHQWFYGVVGNDQVREPWLDEAMATWLSLAHVRSGHPELFAGLWQQRVGQFVRNVPPGPGGVNQPIYAFADDQLYFNTVYRSGATFLEEVYQAMGDRAFFDALRGYVRVFQDAIATGPDLLQALHDHSSQPLGTVIARNTCAPRYRGDHASWPPTWPAGETWAGPVTFRTEAPVKLRILVDDRLVTEGGPGSIAFDTSVLAPGHHLITLLGHGPGGPVGATTRRVQIRGTGAPGSRTLDRPGSRQPSTANEGNPGAASSPEATVTAVTALAAAAILLRGLLRRRLARFSPKPGRM